MVDMKSLSLYSDLCILYFEGGDIQDKNTNEELDNEVDEFCQSETKAKVLTTQTSDEKNELQNAIENDFNESKQEENRNRSLKTGQASNLYHVGNINVKR